MFLYRMNEKVHNQNEKRIHFPMNSIVLSDAQIFSNICDIFTNFDSNMYSLGEHLRNFYFADFPNLCFMIQIHVTPNGDASLMAPIR